MRQYRFARRAFMAGVGAATGLQILLRNLEAAAQGVPSPPRFLMMHWPVGTVRYRYLPQGIGRDYVTSPILKPFEDAGLREDMIALYGLSTADIGGGGGGGHEAGTPLSSTGATCPGTRRTGGEPDDACAGGPSWDQIFLKRVPELARPGTGYANAICDARVDSLEVSPQCLSYSHTTRSVVSERPNAGGMITEHTPLLPTLSPVQLYMNLFSGFMPGGDSAASQAELLRALNARKSVLDYARSELKELELLAPGSEKSKIDFHAESIRKIEEQLSAQIASGGMAPGCTLPAKPDSNLSGPSGGGNSGTEVADDAVHAEIGKLHMGILRAAFQCDVLRVATFQWSPGNNHVSFKGLYPDEPNGVYMHHPLSHRINNRADVDESMPSDTQLASTVEFLVRVQTWYNARTAELLNELKLAKDANGNSLLDYTICPFITEVGETTHSWSPMPAMIFGGRALGMQGGQFQNFQGNLRHHNDLWLSIAQAYFKSADPLPALAQEIFHKQGVSAIPGLWSPVA